MAENTDRWETSEPEPRPGSGAGRGCLTALGTVLTAVYIAVTVIQLSGSPLFWPALIGGGLLVGLAWAVVLVARSADR